MDRISWKSTFGLALAAMVCLLAAPASAGIVYNVTNDLTHQNGWSLAGTITASGVGTYTNASAITAWDITATKDSVSRRYSNTTTSASVPKNVIGTLNATLTTLSLAANSSFFLREATVDAQVNWDNSMFQEYSAGWVSSSNLWMSTPFDSIPSVFSPVVDGAWTLGTATPSGVPEIDPAGMGSVLALVTGALGLLERRRLKMA